MLVQSQHACNILNSNPLFFTANICVLINMLYCPFNFELKLRLAWDTPTLLWSCFMWDLGNVLAVGTAVQLFSLTLPAIRTESQHKAPVHLCSFHVCGRVTSSQYRSCAFVSSSGGWLWGMDGHSLGMAHPCSIVPQAFTN